MLRASSLGLLYTSSVPRHTWRNPVLRSLFTQCPTTIRVASYRGNAGGSYPFHYHRQQSNVAGSRQENMGNTVSPLEIADFLVTEPPPYPHGRSLTTSPIPPLFGGKYRDETGFNVLPPEVYEFIASRHFLNFPRIIELDQDAGDATVTPPNTDNSLQQQPQLIATHLQRYYAYLHVIGNTQSDEEAWTAYKQVMTRYPSVHGQPPVPFPHLHRMCRLLASKYPKNHVTCTRLMKVMYTIHSHGGQLKLFEWNSLLDSTARGWKVVQMVDFDRAMSLFQDMVTGNPPGTTNSLDEFSSAFDSLPQQQPIKPDIYTYTTLLNIAVMTHSQLSIQQTSEMLDASGSTPSRITHLTLLKHFTKLQQLHSIRFTLQKLDQQGHELGLDGINAVLWALFHCDRLDLAQQVYQVLRYNLPAAEEPHDDELGWSDEDLESLRRQLAEEEFILITPSMRPNTVTFNTMIQGFAFHGHFSAAIRVLSDMMSSPNTDLGAPLERDEAGRLQHSTYNMSFAVFRALFLGFSRHGVSSLQDPNDLTDDAAAWTLENLRAVFDLFVDVGKGTRLPRAVLYWIMVAFDKTSNHDVGLLRDVWTEMELVFRVSVGGKYNRLRHLKAILFSSGSRKYLKRYGFRMKRPEDKKEY